MAWRRTKTSHICFFLTRLFASARVEPPEPLLEGVPQAPGEGHSAAGCLGKRPGGVNLRRTMMVSVTGKWLAIGGFAGEAREETVSFAQCAGLAGCIPVDCANPHEAPNARVRGGVTAVGWDGALATSNKNYRSFAHAVHGSFAGAAGHATQQGHTGNSSHAAKQAMCPPAASGSKCHHPGPRQREVTRTCAEGGGAAAPPRWQRNEGCRRGGGRQGRCPQEQTSAKACHSRNRASCAGAPAQSRVDAAAGAGALVGNWTNRAGAKKERARLS